MEGQEVNDALLQGNYSLFLVNTSQGCPHLKNMKGRKEGGKERRRDRGEGQ